MSEEVKTQIEKREQFLKSAQQNLAVFLGSPNGDNVVEYLLVAMQVRPLLKDTPEKTAFQLGMLEVIDQLSALQNKARGRQL